VQEDLARRKEWAKAKGLEEVDRISPKPGANQEYIRRDFGLLKAMTSKIAINLVLF